MDFSSFLWHRVYSSTGVEHAETSLLHAAREGQVFLRLCERSRCGKCQGSALHSCHLTPAPFGRGLGKKSLLSGCISSAGWRGGKASMKTVTVTNRGSNIRKNAVARELSYTTPAWQGHSTLYWHLSLGFAVETGARWVNLAPQCHLQLKHCLCLMIAAPWTASHGVSWRARGSPAGLQQHGLVRTAIIGELQRGVKAHGWGTIAFRVLSATEEPTVLQKILLAESFSVEFMYLFYCYFPSPSSHVFHFLLYPSASSFLPSTGTVFTGCFIALELFCMKIHWKSHQASPLHSDNVAIAENMGRKKWCKELVIFL